MPEGPFDIILSRYAAAQFNWIQLAIETYYQHLSTIATAAIAASYRCWFWPVWIWICLFLRPRSLQLDMSLALAKVCLYLQSPQLSTVLADMVQRLRPGGFLVIGAKVLCTARFVESSSGQHLEIVWQCLVVRIRSGESISWHLFFLILLSLSFLGQCQLVDWRKWCHVWWYSDTILNFLNHWILLDRFVFGPVSLHWCTLNLHSRS